MERNVKVEDYRNCSSCEETMHVNFDEKSAGNEIDSLILMLKKNCGNMGFDSELKHYDITVHYKNDPNDNRMQICGLETDDLESAKEFVMDEFGGGIDYYVIEDTEGDEYYDSSEDISLEEKNENVNKENKAVDELKNEVDLFKADEIALKKKLIDAIKSEFEKYHSDKVKCNFDDTDEPDYDDYFRLIPVIDCICKESTYMCGFNEFEKSGDNIKLNCDQDAYEILDETNPFLFVETLYSLLVVLQHPLTKKANKK